MSTAKRFTAAVAAASVAAASFLPITSVNADGWDHGDGYADREYASDRYDDGYGYGADRRFRGFQTYQNGGRGDWRDRDYREWRAEQDRQAELAAREEQRRAEKREDKRERKKIAKGVAIGLGVLMLGAILSQADRDHYRGRRHRY
jgi:hypothetical protein